MIALTLRNLVLSARGWNDQNSGRFDRITSGISRLNGPRQLDALSEVFRSTRLSGGVFLRGEFTEPWCVTTAVNASDCTEHLGPTDHLVLYHYVVEGALTIDSDSLAPTTFLPGEAAIFPRNDRHRLSGRESANAVSALGVAQIPNPGDIVVIEHGGGGSRTRIVCGFLGGRGLANDPLLSSLPSLLRYDSATTRSGPLVRESLRYAADEIDNGRPGTDAILARISEMLFIEAVRSFLETLPPNTSGWMSALKDRALSKAVALIHRYPDKQWTVEVLGEAVGASRSSLAEKFVRHLDTAPAEYLTQHRMHIAARRLASTDDSILNVAESVGYGSEAAFSRAFKRTFKVSPSVWRRDAAI